MNTKTLVLAGLLLAGFNTEGMQTLDPKYEVLRAGATKLIDKPEETPWDLAALLSRPKNVTAEIEKLSGLISAVENDKTPFVDTLNDAGASVQAKDRARRELGILSSMLSIERTRLTFLKNRANKEQEKVINNFVSDSQKLMEDISNIAFP